MKNSNPKTENSALSITLLEYIFSFLGNPKHLITAGKTCKQWRTASNNDALWLELLRMHFPAAEEGYDKVKANARQLFIQTYQYSYRPSSFFTRLERRVRNKENPTAQLLTLVKEKDVGALKTFIFENEMKVVDLITNTRYNDVNHWNCMNWAKQDALDFFFTLATKEQLVKPGDMQTLLYWAVICNQTETIRKHKEECAERRYEYDFNLLHVAARYNRADIIEILLETCDGTKLLEPDATATVNYTDKDSIFFNPSSKKRFLAAKLSLTALHVAALMGNQEAAKYLIANGAAVDSQSRVSYVIQTNFGGGMAGGYTKIRYTVSPLSPTPLIIAIQCKKTAMIKFLLTQGADIHCERDKSEYRQPVSALEYLIKDEQLCRAVHEWCQDNKKDLVNVIEDAIQKKEGKKCCIM